MTYHQLTSDAGYMISAYRLQGDSIPIIACKLKRHRSTIWREIQRNRCHDQHYRPSKAITHTCRRRREARRRWYFTDQELQIVTALLHQDWSPEQVAGGRRRYRVLAISHATIYRFIWYDQFNGGYLYTHLRQTGKDRRKRYGRPDSRGVLPGKRHLSERPPGAKNRSRIGHWELDTMRGGNDLHCVVTMVERKSKYTLIGKLKARTKAELNRRPRKLLNYKTPEQCYALQ